jgi:hypothetical protein
MTNRPSSVSSLVNCAADGSSRSSPAARSSRLITGWSALLLWWGEQ